MARNCSLGLKPKICIGVIWVLKKTKQEFADILVYDLLLAIEVVYERKMAVIMLNFSNCLIGKKN